MEMAVAVAAGLLAQEVTGIHQQVVLAAQERLQA
jgi:hypothetical protein